MRLSMMILCLTIVGVACAAAATTDNPQTQSSNLWILVNASENHCIAQI